MKPQMGWEVARAAAWQEYGAEGWSHLEAKQGQETKGWAVGAVSNPHPLALALALPPVCLETLSPCSFLCPFGAWDCWDLGRDPFRRRVRSTLLGLLIYCTRDLWP